MRYFLIIASVLPILLAVGLTLLSEFDRVSAGLHLGLALVVLPLFLANLSRAIDVRDRLGQRFEEITTLRDRLVSAYAMSVGRSPETLRIIWGQGGPALWSPCAALWYGDAHASSTGEGAVALPSFSEEIAELCPNQRMLFQHRFLHVPGTGWVTLEEIEEDDEIDVAWDLVLESDASVAASPLFAGASVVEHDGCGIVFIGRQTNTGVEQEQGESR